MQQEANENKIKGFCLEALVSAPFLANKWFIENNVLALKRPDSSPRYEIDVWASKILSREREEWKFISCKNVSSSKHLKKYSEEIHSHIYKSYSDSMVGRVSISGYLAFSKESKKDDTIYQNLSVVSPIDLNIDKMINGFDRFDESKPEKSCTILYLLYLIIAKYIEENSYTQNKLKKAGIADYELISFSKYKYNIKKSLAWELNTNLRFFDLFSEYQANRRLIEMVTRNIVAQLNCPSMEGRKDFNVQFAYFVQIQNKILSLVSVIRNALKMEYTSTGFPTKTNNPLVKRLVDWKLRILKDSALLFSIIPQFQFLFCIMGGVIFENEFDEKIIKKHLNLDFRRFAKGLEYFEKLFPLKNKKWFKPFSPKKEAGVYYFLRPDFMKCYAYFSRYYFLIKEDLKPKNYHESALEYIIDLIKQIDSKWAIFERFSLLEDETFSNIIHQFGN